MPSYKREEILNKISLGIKKRGEELAKIIANESGKPIKYARAEVKRASMTFQIASQEVMRINGEVLSLDAAQMAENRIGIIRRFPIGIILAISPFNFPLNLIAHKIAPCIASGNVMILKPASATPLTALLLGEILLEAGILAGSVNILPCNSNQALELVKDERLKMLTFTGSAEVGWNLKSQAGRKRVCLELGGNAAIIIEPDCDLDWAVKRTSTGAYAYAGQVCISVQRIYIHKSIYNTFKEKYIRAIKQLNYGNPLDEQTDIGPMIDEDSIKRIDRWVKEAQEQGAKLLIGGKQEDNIYLPTLLENVTNEMKVYYKEVFAPVSVLLPYDNFEEAINMVNDSDYGLQAGLFTNSNDKIMLAYNRIEVGGLLINDTSAFRVDIMPYGGIKKSGFGREGLRYVIEEMTEMKLLILDNPQ